MTVPRRPGTTVAQVALDHQLGIDRGILQLGPQWLQDLADDLRIDREVDAVARRPRSASAEAIWPTVKVTSRSRSAFLRVTGPARMSWAWTTAWSMSRLVRVGSAVTTGRAVTVRSNVDRLPEDQIGRHRSIDLLAGPGIERFGRLSR